jgi:hypothetical protein
MISVQNRLLRLSGNRWYLFIVIALVFAACSPKVRPVAVQPVKKEPVQSFVQVQPEKVKPAPPKISTISLMLPFGLDHLRPGSAYTPESLKEADIALGYYRGFKLALDSLTAKGYNYKLLVFDTKAPVHDIATNNGVKGSDLIVGPVFPDEIKAFTFSYGNTLQPLASPLSPAPPSTFKKNNLITLTPPLEYHALAAAKYINDKIRPRKIFILKSGFSDENNYLIPFKKAIDSLSKKSIQVIDVSVMHGRLNSIIPQLSASAKNVFIMPATDQHFLTVTLKSLDSLNNSYPVILFGHPNWVNFTFLQAPMLQRLNTIVSSAEHVDYRTANTVEFMHAFREAYHTEPNEYAIKGFDEGMYLGRALATDGLKNLDAMGFTGLHNNFQFQKKPGLGWINTYVSLFKYANFELKKIE